MIREVCCQELMLCFLVTEHNSRNPFFVTDDLDPEDIMEKGHLNSHTDNHKERIDSSTIQMAT
jgi:adenine deaminase